MMDRRYGWESRRGEVRSQGLHGVHPNPKFWCFSVAELKSSLLRDDSANSSTLQKRHQDPSTTAREHVNT